MSEAEQKVREKWPDAWWSEPGCDCCPHAVYSGATPDRLIGQGKTKKAAWADAAQRIEVSNASKR